MTQESTAATAGITPSRLRLRYDEWQAYIKAHREQLPAEQQQWLGVWEMNDLWQSPMEDSERRLLRYGHYTGWFDALERGSVDGNPATDLRAADARALPTAIPEDHPWNERAMELIEALTATFAGHGKGRVKPVNVPEGTKPVAVTPEAARRLIESEAEGPSTHSREGGTVWVLVTHYKERGIPFRVERLTTPDGMDILGYLVHAATHINTAQRL